MIALWGAPLLIVDNCSRELVHIETSTSIPGSRVARALDRIRQQRKLPLFILSDNGPEFTSHALRKWTSENSVEHCFIQPGKPMQNAFAESIIGKFQDECLSMHAFSSLSNAREIIETWRMEYNTERPHSSLNYLTPGEFLRGFK